MTREHPPFVIKVCGITCEEDALVAIDAGANALGFNFYSRSPRYIDPELAREIGRMTGDYLKVGVFVNAVEHELTRIARIAELDVLQLHGDTAELPAGQRLWRSIAGTSGAPARDHRIEAYVLDAPTPAFGGSGRTFDWSQAANFPYRAIVAGGLDAANVADAIAAMRPWGVDACSRLESRPGRKDAQKVREFVAAAVNAFELLSSEVSAL
jgi:phosphoribosylanthranilate isomerase